MKSPILQNPSRMLIVYPTVLLLGILSALACSREPSPEKKKPAFKDAVLVIFAQKDTRLTREGATLPLRAGMLLNQKDTVTTKKGTADLQTRSGGVLRIKEFSTVSLDRVIGPGGNINQFHLKSGGVIARVKRTGPREKFRIVTPTSIASVRGTTFSVSLSDGKIPLIRVFAGRVALRPRARELEKFSKKEVKRNPVLRKIDETLKSKEVTLSPDTSGRLSKKAVQKVNEINEKLKKARRSRKPVAENKELVKTIDEAAKDTRTVETRREKATEREKVENKTLVKVDEKIVETAVRREEPKPSLTEKEKQLLKRERTKIRDQIQKEYDSKLNHVVVSLKKALDSRKFKSNKDLQKHYKIDVIDVITLKNGKKLSGVIVTHAGKIIILHSTRGINRVSKRNVKHIDFMEVK